MLYIKIMSNDGTIIGAEAHESPAYVNHPNKSKIPLRCSPIQAQGVLSLDVSQIYQLSGRPEMPGDYLVAEEISGADYDNLIEELDIDPDDPDPDDPDVEPDPDVMTPQEMRLRILELEEDSAKKDRHIEFLEDCLLEMSEVVYGEDDD